MLVSLLVVGAAASGARSPPDSLPPRGSLAGTVVATATGLPVEGAIVQLEAAVEAGAGPPQGGDVAAAAGPVVWVTDAQGVCRFGGLAPGACRLFVRHLGYHPASMRVDLARAVPFRVSVALVVNAILVTRRNGPRLAS